MLIFGGVIIGLDVLLRYLASDFVLHTIPIQYIIVNFCCV